MFHELIKIWFTWVHDWGYVGIFFLMAMESSIIPVPSEIVMPPAAFWAAQGKFSFVGVVLAGTAGSYFGSILNYWFFQWVGRPAVVKYGKYFFISESKLSLAETWAQKYGVGGIFVSRLLPVVRHLISIPAGILKMSFKWFSISTILGAATWCWVLSLWGQKIIGVHPDLLDSPEKMSAAIRSELMGFVGAVVAFAALYIVIVYFKNKNAKAIV